MLEKIILTVASFLFFVYILLGKMIKKNDTTYLVVLGLQTIGILINLLQLTVGIFAHIGFTITIYLISTNVLGNSSKFSFNYM